MVSLSSLLQDQIKKHRQETEELLSKTTEGVYSSQIASRIDEYRSAVEDLTQMFIVKETRGKPKTQVSTPSISSSKMKNLPLKEAIGLWVEYDIERGHKPISDTGYSYRIRTAAKNGDLKVRRKGKRLLFVNREGLNNLMQQYV